MNLELKNLKVSSKANSIKPDNHKNIQDLESDKSENKRSDNFEDIIRTIKEGFHPVDVNNEEECEKQLIHFLETRFPKNIIRRGHSPEGRRIDIVITGIFALELIIVENEGKLIFLLNHVLKIKDNFSKVAVVLIDVGKISTNTISNYVKEFEQSGINTIIK